MKNNEPTKKSFLAELAQLAAGYRRQIEAEVDGFDPDPARRLERRQRAQASFRYFAQTYFPHYVKCAPASVHDYLFERFQTVVDNGVGDHDAVAAPRGHAKSTIVTQIGTLWCIVTGRKRYPLIVMDAIEQAWPMLEAIKAELEFNPRLALDFPEATGRGRVWQVGTIVTPNDVKVEVFGSGKKIRGRRHGPHRPDLVIGDDLENDENVRSPEQRDKLMGWVNKSLLSLGAADDSLDVFIIGTILHYDSVLSRLIKNPLWTGIKFRAVERWPERMDLWDRWQEILLNDGAEQAATFYALQQPEMDRGARICWPGGTTFYKLMVKRARDGKAAFDSEQQNEPLSGDDAPFDGAITFWVNRLAEWVFYGACDPSLGKAGSRRDPSALLVGGLNRETGILDVVEAAIRKRLPDRIIEDIIAFQREYRCLVWGVETVQFQEFLRTELVKRSAARGIPVPARAVKPIDDKKLRIESLQPHVQNGLIRLFPDQHTLIEQLEHFPMADHDDGPDALHMLWAIARSGAGRIEYTPAPRHGGGRWSGNW
ncbi:phage terminase large subunit [Laribacter hongkongensis]|uniref:Phage protein n=1 Tax=Laribacter hongkongensis TaxID=168471 RepID=A0A248LI01_9NEIS|nr:phage terminase large subunit [Laribacter hongkongensis]ASJ24145.1 phage protein [Laribacter hongkongensis]MCG9060265.1 phage terminase large subunit [Laribacter hongkongensis]MCG9087346.1 phage terminase large subunit [Laribacter hongkongensis]MCG9090233.1 phage terminase large subunit [Laribacter hongkongensis]MCG9111102.1 phage terminase large subunit [Laribacter hongkongensis]